MMSGEDESEEQVKAILDMAIIYLKVKNIGLWRKNNSSL